VLAAGLQKKIKTIILRLSNSFGAPVSPDVNRWTLLANDLCRQAVEKGRLKLLSNGCQYRDFVCLSDVERTLSAIVSAGPEHFNRLIYNLGAGKSMRVKEMAELIASSFKTMTGKDLAIEFPAGATESKEHELVFDISRLISEGIQIKNDFKEEIKQLLDFCFEYFHPID
jgi:UDP-glucose 4-epimerase